MTQEEQFQGICDKLKSLSIEEKKQQFVDKSKFTGGLSNLGLEHVLYAISNHDTSREAFSAHDLIIMNDRLWYNCGFVNNHLIYKSRHNYSKGDGWLFEAALDIYLGLYEIGLMNYPFDTIYKLLREKVELTNEINNLKLKTNDNIASRVFKRRVN